MGDPSENLASEIYKSCLAKMSFYAKKPNTHRIEKKDLPGLASLIAKSSSPRIVKLFTDGIPLNYHTGAQFEPRFQKSTSILQQAFIASTCLVDFEDGFLLGPFPKNTRFLHLLYYLLKLLVLVSD